MKLKRVGLLLLLIIVLFVGGLYVWAKQQLETPVSHSQANQYVEIARGSSPDEIISKLNDLGVIRRGWLLRLYVRFSGTGSRMKAGEYRFPSPISPLGVLRKLEEGEQRLNRLTIVEGWTRWDIAAQLARIPELKLQSPEEALALMDDTSLIRDLDPNAKNLEGYLFPDTYSFPPDSDAKRVVETMVKRFRQVWDGLVAKTPTATGKSPREVVTVASLIETEAKLAEERPIVSSVIYNRL